MVVKNINEITITMDKTQKEVKLYGRILGCVTNEEANGIRQVSDYRRKAWSSVATPLCDIREAIKDETNRNKLRLVVAVKESKDITFDQSLSLLVTDIINGLIELPNNCLKLIGKNESIHIS